MLAAMAAIVGLTVVFAGGVERGKQLVRSERMLLSRQEPARPAPARSSAGGAASAPGPAAEPETTAKPKVVPALGPTTMKPKTRVVEQPGDAAPAASAQAREASPARGRYAVQVVSYKRAQLAQEEMQRLRGRGERAFLLLRNGMAIVYVGPFPSKENAREKSTSLKPRYQDCFVRTL